MKVEATIVRKGLALQKPERYKVSRDGCVIIDGVEFFADHALAGQRVRALTLDGEKYVCDSKHEKYLLSEVETISIDLMPKKTAVRK